jgi:two-component system sensor histidine kinase/response regulator
LPASCVRSCVLLGNTGISLFTTYLRSLKRELLDTLGHRYTVETATGGEEALTLFEEILADGYEVPLVIVDQIMPGLKGDELLKRIHVIAPKTLKIMLTGQADMSAVINALNHANLYRYIPKPWERIDLAMTIKEALQRYLQDKELELQNTILRETNKTLEMKVKERTALLEIQKVELKKLNASKDKFFSIIAHDLRTPFSGLLGIIDFMSKHLQTFSQDDIKENVDCLQDAAKTLYTLLENLLTWSRLQRGAMECHPEDIALDEITMHNIRLFTSKAEQKDISLINQVSEGTKVYADKQMIHTVMRNLLSNALKFTYKGGTVSLSTHQNKTSVALAISDTGTGIPQEDIPQLFRIDVKYSRIGTAGEEGTGLGLVLCKDLVEKNGGKIGVESEVGHGTTFTIQLPVEG